MSNDPKSSPPKPETISMNAADFQKALTEALSKGISEGMTMAAMAAAKNAPAGPVNPRFAAVARVSKPCQECRQESAACGGKHAQVVVYPKDGRWGKWFQGVWLNGVRYLSNHSSHEITVPAEAQIGRIVDEWESNEIEVSSGRKASHNSGIMGQGGSNVNTNVPYFR